jgi:hypothetical protein
MKSRRDYSWMLFYLIYPAPMTIASEYPVLPNGEWIQLDFLRNVDTSAFPNPGVTYTEAVSIIIGCAECSHPFLF